MQIKSQIEKYINIFSKDKTQNQAMRLALLLTFIIWMILFVVLAVSPGWNQKKKYKTIRISLAPLEEVRKEEKNPLEQKTIGKTKAAEPAKREEAQKKVDVKKTVQAEKKSQPAKQPVQEAKKANIKYGKSVDELLEAQNSVSKKKTFDWDSMDFSENTNFSSSEPKSNVQKLDNSSSFSGTAGTKTVSDGRVSSETQKSSAGSDVSSKTLSQLGAISKSEYSSVAAAGLESVAKGINQHLSGKYSMSMQDGSSRILLYPDEPRLKISEENSRTIDSTRNLTITLKILADGTVPLGGVFFSPASAIDSAVRSELAAQIQTWRFSSALTDGQASFYYSIIKR